MKRGKGDISVVHLGVAFGIAFALYSFIIGIFAWQFGIGVQMVDLISSWYIGFHPTFLGSLIGAVWGFVDGFVMGVIIAWIYNWFVKNN